MELLLEYLNKGILAMLAVSMPCICTAAAVGLIVGILQAVTQVQEQTIAAAPKVVGVFLVILFGGVGFARLLENIFLEGTNLAFDVIPKQDTFALSTDYYKYTKPFSEEMNLPETSSTGFTKRVKQNPSNAPYLEKSKTTFHKYPTDRNSVPKPDFMEEKVIRGN